ncbi:DNA endonuclease III [Sulfolobus sp. SCGC AB-777_L09]|nr:endonuclease III domain-containing protein [Stygiolobus sp.]MDT7876467.1 endonuclease III domain-containing protein [Sulfolobaceae archaeon]PVU70802.1 DNA endonuclease III [Sulfolobus sp. SCGC AB-777_L09]
MTRTLPEEVKKSLHTDTLIKILEQNKETLAKAGWIITDPYSPEWWDGIKSVDYLVISSILVQMTKWETVKKVLEKLREVGITKVTDLGKVSEKELEELIKPVNFYKTKAKRLRKIAETTEKIGGIEKLVRDEKLLKQVEGIGEETAEALLLFAGNIPVFPRSNYSRKVLGSILNFNLTKEDAKRLIEEKVGKDLYKLKIIHAGLVTVGKLFCTNNPKCKSCLFKDICKYYQVKKHEIVRV